MLDWYTFNLSEWYSGLSVAEWYTFLVFPLSGGGLRQYLEAVTAYLPGADLADVHTHTLAATAFLDVSEGSAAVGGAEQGEGFVIGND